jgi:hypothetical protein
MSKRWHDLRKDPDDLPEDILAATPCDYDTIFGPYLCTIEMESIRWTDACLSSPYSGWFTYGEHGRLPFDDGDIIAWTEMPDPATEGGEQ